MNEKATAVMFSLESEGLIAVKDAAERRGWAVKSVQNWVNAGLIPFTIAGGGMRSVFLLRIADVDAFTPPPRGRPAGNLAEKEEAPKPTANKAKGKVHVKK